MSVKSTRQVGVPSGKNNVADSTANAATLPELIATIPRAFQPALGEILTKQFRVAQKHANVQSTITIYERHDVDNSFPPLIRNSLKEPKLQFAKEFLATSDGAESPDTFHQQVVKARSQVLKTAIAVKQKERDHLATLIRFNQSGWQQAINNVAIRILESVGGRVQNDAQGKTVFSGLPETAKSEKITLEAAGETYSFRCVALSKAAIDRAELQKLAKIKLKDNTDVEMTDVKPEKPVRDIIREEIQSLEKRLATKPKNAKTPSKKAKPKGQSNAGVRKQKGKSKGKKKSR